MEIWKDIIPKPNKSLKQPTWWDNEQKSMSQTPVQAGIFLIDDYVFADEGGALPQLKQFLNELAAKLDLQIFGITITRNKKLASNPSYYQDYLGPSIRLVSALMLPAESGTERGSSWADRFSAGLAAVIASMPVRKDLGVGVWYYVESGSRASKQPLELVYWVLLFTGYNPLFMRRVVNFIGSFIECPSHPRASDIVVRKGRDYRDVMLMSLAAIHLGVAHTPHRIAKTIEEVLGYREFGTADSLRKKVKAVLRDAASYCLVSIESHTAYTISPFGKLLLNALLSNNLMQYLSPGKAATFIRHIIPRSGVE
jgi:hypothetical protein